MIHSGFESLFDEMFNDFDDEIFGRRPMLPAHGGGHRRDLMRTDVSETDQAYNLEIDLPGFKKDDIKIKYDEGMLTISAEKNEDIEEREDKNGKPRKNGSRLIRKERHFGSMSRSWYVGEDVKKDDIKASYKDGVLSLTVPKAEPKPELPEDQKFIAIEG
ncbi:Hsp20/alpha crystallin family protein [Candidatus Saccharibacteria bacterium]|nr:Hsp20/alpha crystallin family protein [Candidatus Saccharibacteria bacterium]